MLHITGTISIPDEEIVLHAVRSQGPGGQNVNKVSTAMHLRFDVRASSLPADVKDRLLALRDRRITAEGEVVIKAQQYRSQEMNRQDALDRLSDLVRGATIVRAKRRPTRPSRAARALRLRKKRRRSVVKQMRGRSGYEEE